MDKRQLLITTAFNLFYRHGIHSTGINTILSESGVAKKTLYNHFESKNALILATLELRNQHFYHWLSNRLANVTAGKDALYELFFALDDWFNQKVTELSPFCGCYFINTAAEFKASDDPIHQLCAQHKEKIQQLITKHIELITDDKPQQAFLITAIMTLKEGAIVQAHVLNDAQSAIKAKAILHRLLA